MDVLFYEENTAFQQILDTYFDKNCLWAAVAKKKQIKWSLFTWIGTQDQALATRSQVLNLEAQAVQQRKERLRSFCKLRENFLDSYLTDRQAHRNQAATPRQQKRVRRIFVVVILQLISQMRTTLLNNRQGIAWFRLLFSVKFKE